MANGYGRSNDGFGITRQESVALIVKTAIDNGVTDPRHIAYMLATAQHETRNFTAPDEDFGRQQARKLGYSGGEEYFGRGYVHLTHIENYQKFDKLLGLEGQLVQNPELAKDPEIAAKILVIGMRDGLFTGKPLSRYINDESHDTYNARRVVNGVNPKQPWSVKAARECATYTQQWEKFLTPERIAQLKTERISPDHIDIKIQDVQSALNHLGYKGVNGKPLAVDGVIGSQTKSAIEAFQKDHGLAVNGVVDPQTLKALEEAKVKQQATPDATIKGVNFKERQHQTLINPSIETQTTLTKEASSIARRDFLAQRTLGSEFVQQVQNLQRALVDAIKQQQSDTTAHTAGTNTNVASNILVSPDTQSNVAWYCAHRCSKESLPLEQVNRFAIDPDLHKAHLVGQDRVVTVDLQKAAHTPAEQSISSIHNQQHTNYQPQQQHPKF